MEALGAPLDMRKNGMSVAGTLTNAVFMSDWTEDNLQTLVNGWFADYPCGDGPLSYFETENSKSHSNFYANAEFDDLMA
jgi:hypothetical protein